MNVDSMYLIRKTPTLDWLRVGGWVSYTVSSANRSGTLDQRFFVFFGIFIRFPGRLVIMSNPLPAPPDPSTVQAPADLSAIELILKQRIELKSTCTAILGSTMLQNCCIILKI